MALLAMSQPCRAGNLAAEFSHGPTLPFFTMSFDDKGDAHGNMLSAGAGYSFNWNLYPGATGEVRKLTLGVPIFANIVGGDPETFSLAAGGTIGTLNNLIAVGAAIRLIDAAPGRLPQGVADGFDSTDVMVLVSFGFNMGGGTPASSPAHGLKLRDVSEQKPPPNYFHPW
jgi:hypothetical protein